MKQTSGAGEREQALWMGWEQSHRHLKKVYLSPVPSIHSANLLLPWIFKPSCQQQREQLQWQSWQVSSWCPRLPTLASGSVWLWGGGDAACIADSRQRAIEQPSPMLPKQQESGTHSPWRAQDCPLFLTWVCQMLQMFGVMWNPGGKRWVWDKKEQQLHNVRLKKCVLLLGENSETKSCRLPGKLDIHSPRQITGLVAYLAKVPMCYEMPLQERSTCHRQVGRWMVLQCHGRVERSLSYEVGTSSRGKTWTLLRWPSCASPQFRAQFRDRAM